MGQVTVAIHGQGFQLACKDGEEARIQSLAAYIDQKLDALKGSLGGVADSQLFLMAALVIADELMEARERGAAVDDGGMPAVVNLADRLSTAAAEIEDIAARLENA